MCWQHPTRGLLTDGAFVDLAEDTGLVRPVGDWGVAEACPPRAVWREELGDLTVRVSVSLRQLVRPGFARQFLTLVERAGGDVRRIGIEVTESALADEKRRPLRE